MDQDRTLSDSDVVAIVNALKRSVVNEFYADLGRGLWAHIKKALFDVAIVFAAYGAIKGTQ